MKTVKTRTTSLRNLVGEEHCRMVLADVISDFVKGVIVDEAMVCAYIQKLNERIEQLEAELRATNNSTDGKKLLTWRDICTKLAISKSAAVNLMHRDPTFPKPCPFSSTLVRFDASKVDAWISRNFEQSIAV